MDTDVIDVDTSRRRIVDLTDSVREFCGAAPRWPVQRVRAARDGRWPANHRDRRRLRTTTCSIPWNGCCRATTATGTHHGSAKAMAQITSFPPWYLPSVTPLPVQAGNPLLGTWQESVVLVDLNGDNPQRCGAAELSGGVRLVALFRGECAER